MGAFFVNAAVSVALLMPAMPLMKRGSDETGEKGAVGEARTGGGSERKGTAVLSGALLVNGGT